MEWVKNLNAAMDYIEANLEGDISYDRLAELACCSGYHFQRMFSYIANMPLGEYIRRRKMARAAADLINGERVLDTALKYGYDSPTAFSRAFKSVHGISPSEAQAGADVRAFLPISFSFVLKGGTVMDYRIEKREAFRIVGYSTPISGDMEQNFVSVPKFWEELGKSGAIQKLIPLMDMSKMGIYAVCGDEPQGPQRYTIGVATEAELPEGMEERIIGAYTWAVFPGSGNMPDSIQELEKRIMLEWLPTSGYEYAQGPDVELYLSPYPKANFEVWIPVVKK